jgi:hypothetical protein
MKTLADELLEALPTLLAAHPAGPMAGDIARRLAVGPQHARAACLALDGEGRAMYVRYQGSKARHLIPLDGLPKGRIACGWCRVVTFARNDRRCCSPVCGAKYYWATAPAEERERRLAGVIDKSRSPEGRAKRSEVAQARFADPAMREEQSRRSKEMWSDPRRAAVLRTKLQAASSDPDRRKAMSERRKRDWQDPAYREKLVGAHREVAKTPEYRARRSAVSKALWADPVSGEKRRAKSRENIQAAIAAVR